MDWLKLAIEGAMVALGAYSGVKVALAELRTKVQFLEDWRGEVMQGDKEVRGILGEHGPRIAVIESKINVRYRDN